MHTEVFNNIDTLIKMANSPLNVDEINMELSSLKKQIKKKENDIEDLKNLMTEARYFNASNELVDKNIEVSLKNKITRLNRKLKDLKRDVDEIKNQEKNIHNDITSLKSKFAQDEEYVAKIKTKAENSSANEYYKNLLVKEEANAQNLKAELTEKENQYQEILEELNTKNTDLSELNAKLDNEKKHLNDIQANLQNSSSYIDEDLKAADEEKLATLTQDLENLEKRKVELLTDANMVGADAKELIIDNDYYEAINKIKELVKIVKKKPYMDINSTSILEEELEKKESLRVELSTLIDNKNYEELDTDAILKRKDYIKSEIENNNKTIASYQEEINNIDSFVNETLGESINNLEQEIIKIEKNINEYRVILKDKNKSNRSKLNLESTISKKEKEKEILNEILSSYKTDLLNKINRTTILNNLINSLNEDIAGYNKEQENLQKLSLLDFKTKDYAEEESDKEKLKEINEEIKEIKNRQGFDKTPDEIFDQIDMLLADVKPKEIYKEEKEETKEAKKPVSLEIDSLLSNNVPVKEEIAIESNINNALEYTGVIPDIPLNNETNSSQNEKSNNEEVAEELTNNNNNDNTNNEEILIEDLNEPTTKIEEENKSLEDIDNNKIENLNDNSTTENRIKVIKMIPVETVKNSTATTTAGGN